MKKLTAVFDEDTDIDFEALAKISANAIEFRIEQCQNSKRRRNVKTRHYNQDETAVDAIMEHATFGAEFTRESAERWVKAKGYRSTTAGPTLTGMERGGLVKKVGAKRYAFQKTAA